MVAITPPPTRRIEASDPEQKSYRPIGCEPRTLSRRCQKPPARRPPAKSPFKKRQSIFDSGLDRCHPTGPTRRGHFPHGVHVSRGRIRASSSGFQDDTDATRGGRRALSGLRHAKIFAQTDTHPLCRRGGVRGLASPTPPCAQQIAELFGDSFLKRIRGSVDDDYGPRAGRPGTDSRTSIANSGASSRNRRKVHSWRWIGSSPPGLPSRKELRRTQRVLT
jgi:hypothetical protein